ncbi:HAD family phosphatase [bacterium]|nr:HAD family phosphatase [bacterium]
MPTSRWVFFSSIQHGGILFKACIFDMDGVIADSEPIHCLSEQQALEPFGITPTLEELQANTGTGADVLLKRFIERYRLKITLEDLRNRLRLRLEENFRNSVRPIPHALELIRSLHGAGMRLAIGSSSDRRLIDLVMAHFEIIPFFDAIVSGEDVLNTKPAPDIFLEAARRLGCRPAECIVIEDSKNGVLAAKQAGMACIGFVSPNSRSQDLGRADWVIDDLARLDHQILSGMPGTAFPQTGSPAGKPDAQG